jgi:hypothetical protein
MNAIALQQFWPTVVPSQRGSQKDRFREIFQRSLRSCVRRGFTVEESFGMIWVETWEEVAVTEEEQSALYEELIRWAKTALAEDKLAFPTVVHKSYSPSGARL